jgi:hypothetical protein
VVSQSEENEETEETVPSAEPVDEHIKKRIEVAMNLPLPGHKHADWSFDNPLLTSQKKAGWLKYFQSSPIKDEEILQLRKSAVRSPGITKTKIVSLLNKHPHIASLYMIRAICNYANLREEHSSKSRALIGYQRSIKDGMVPLVNNEISLYNTENFFAIYYGYLERLKAEQGRVDSLIKADPRLEDQRKPFYRIRRETEILLSSKRKAENIINQLKKVFKTGRYFTPISYKDIKAACAAFIKGEPKKTIKSGTAEEIISIIYTLTTVFAQIPILSALVNEILNCFPSESEALAQRKHAITSFVKLQSYKLLMLQGNVENTLEKGRALFAENLEHTKAFLGKPIRHSYEVEPFFNVVNITLSLAGILTKFDFAEVIKDAIMCMQMVIQHDVTKQHRYTPMAKNYTMKLTTYLDNMEIDINTIKSSSEKKKGASKAESTDTTE